MKARLAAVFFGALLLPAAAAGDMPPADPPPAAEPAVVVGQPYTAEIVYCRAQKDAEEIAQAFVAHGEAAADEILAKKRGPRVTAGFCAYRIATFVVRRLASTHRGDKEVMHVIEVEDAGGSGTFYVVNSTPVSRFMKERDA